MNDCIFCKIVKGDIASYKIYEDEDNLAFLDSSQISDGHTLLIPKTHVRYVWDIEDAGGFLSAAQKIARSMQAKSESASVVSVTIGEMVPHAHLHLLPDSAGNRDIVLEAWNRVRNMRKLGESEMGTIRDKYKVES